MCFTALLLPLPPACPYRPRQVAGGATSCAAWATSLAWTRRASRSLWRASTTPPPSSSSRVSAWVVVGRWVVVPEAVPEAGIAEPLESVDHFSALLRGWVLAARTVPLARALLELGGLGCLCDATDPTLTLPRTHAQTLPAAPSPPPYTTTKPPTHPPTRSKAGMVNIPQGGCRHQGGRLISTHPLNLLSCLPTHPPTLILPIRRGKHTPRRAPPPRIKEA